MLVIDVSNQHIEETMGKASQQLHKLYALSLILPKNDSVKVAEICESLCSIFEELDNMLHVFSHINKPALIDALHDTAKCIIKGNTQ